MDTIDTPTPGERPGAPWPESEARYRTLFEHAPDAIVVFDADAGEFVEVNENACRLFALPREQLLRMGPWQLSPERQPDGALSAERAPELIAAALEGATPVFEWTHMDSQGNPIPCEVRLVRMPPYARRLVRGSIIDIRERKAVEEAAARREREFRTLAENSPDWIVRVDPQLRVVYANPATLAAARLSEASVLGRRPAESLPGVADVELWEGRLALCVQTREPQLLERDADFDGTLRSVQTTITPEFNAAGELESVLSVTRDVTSVRRAAEVESRLAAIVESANDAIMSATLDGQISSWNKGAERLFGYSADEVLGKTTAFLFGDGREDERAALRARVLAGETVSSYVQDWRARDGRLVTVSSTFFPLRSTDGAIIGTASIAHDLTEEVAAARALALSEERLRLAFEAARMGAWTYYREGGRMEFSAQAAAIYGRTPEEMPKTMRAALALLHPDDAALANRRVREGEVVDAFPREYRVALPDGTYRWICGIGSLVNDDARGTLSGVIMDIHERKLAEDALRQSEERFRTVFNAATVGMIVYDGANVIDANPAASEIFGYPREKLTEPGFFGTLTDPETSARVAARAAARLRGEHVPPGPYEVVARHASGRTLYLDMSASVIDLGGRSATIVAIVDNTERRLAEDALRESEARFRNLVDNSPDYITRLGPDLRFEFVNRTAELQAGLDPAQVLGKRFDELGYPPDAVALWASRLAFVLENARAVEFEYTLPDERREGGKAYRRARLVPELGPDGKAHHILSIVTDITAERLAAEQRRRLDEQMQHAQKLESLGILAGGIAHDFNNLLVAILGNAGLALMELPPESPARQTVQDIETAAQRAAELTRQMLAYSGQGRFVVEPLNLSRLVEEMAHLLEVSVSRRAALHYNFAHDLPAIEADATQVRQVVMNLILNASDALGEEDGAISVSTGLMHADRTYLESAYLHGDAEEGQFVFLEVRDTGCGMDEATQKRIFDPFFTTKFTGRGLGLAAVLGIVRGHGGAIRLVSSKGAGTTFTVLFPVAANQATAAGSSPGAVADGSALARKTVLVVDDDETVRAVTRRILERAGVTVLTAEDGPEGLRLYRETPSIDVVLLDMVMPRMDGEQVLRELLALNPGARVVFMSGYTEQDAAQRFEGTGSPGFIQKPYRPADLLAKIEETLGHSTADD